MHFCKFRIDSVDHQWAEVIKMFLSGRVALGAFEDFKFEIYFLNS